MTRQHERWRFLPGVRLSPGDHVERSQGQFLPGRELRDLLHQELKFGLDAPEIDVLGITSWRGEVEIVWHGDRHATSWLTSRYDMGR
jgi:hypothetical protein